MNLRKAWLVSFKDILEYSTNFAPFVSVFIATLFLSFIFISSIVYFFNSVSILMNFPSMLKDFNVSKYIVTPYFNFVSFLGLMIIPIISARSFSLEKKLKTIELLFTYPFRESELVLGKILSSFVMYGLFLLVSLFYIFSFVIVYSIINKGVIDWGILFSGTLGLLLLGLSAISLSVFVSSLVDDIIPAWVISFVLVLFFWIVGQIADTYTGNTIIKNIMQTISWANNFDNFSKGVIDLKNLTYFVLFILFFSYLSVVSLTEGK